MKYATHFCVAYGRNYDQFSPLSKMWVDAVRKCLRVSLAPLLRECNFGITCELIQDISVTDWFTVFITIKDSFIRPQV